MIFIVYSQLNRAMLRISGARFGLLFTQIAVGALFAASACHATLIYGLRSDAGDTQSIVSFLASNPAVIQTAHTISGLPVGERLSGLTFNPDDGTLYSLAGFPLNGRLLRVNPFNGVVTEIGNFGSVFTGVLGGTTANIAIFPVGAGGRIRTFGNIVTAGVFSAQTNVLINRLTGIASRAVNDLSYVSGDTYFGIVPQLSAHAFTNPHGDALVSTLYGIDTGRQTLVRIGDVSQSGEGSINGGGLTTVYGNRTAYEHALHYRRERRRLLARWIHQALSHQPQHWRRKLPWHGRASLNVHFRNRHS
jgi:hypothetical protein